MLSLRDKIHSPAEALLKLTLMGARPWMFFPPGLSCFADWPDLAASRAPSPLLVQFDSDDDLFSLEGMQAADFRLREHYDRAGRPGAYEGRFYPGPHKFDLAMQLEAFDWLKQNL